MKKYIVTYSDKTEELTDEELLNFIKVAVINNRDIKDFRVTEINLNVRP